MANISGKQLQTRAWLSAKEGALPTLTKINRILEEHIKEGWGHLRASKRQKNN